MSQAKSENKSFRRNYFFLVFCLSFVIVGFLTTKHIMHCITKIDSHVGLTQGWHGLTTVEENITLDNSRINWEVKQDVYRFGTNGTSKANEETETDGRVVNFCTVEDKDYLLGEHSEGYKVIQNSAVFEASMNALTPYGLRLSSVGSLKGRKLVYLSFDIPDEVAKVGNEGFKRYLNVYTSHDGSQKLMMRDSNVRIVCHNTWVASKDSLGNVNLSVRHTSNAEMKLEGWKTGFDQIMESRKVWDSHYKILTETALTADEARFFFAGWLGASEATKTENRLDTLCGLFVRGKGNGGKTKADAFNAITEALTHGAFSRKATIDKASQVKNWFSSEFGTHANQKTKAFELITDDKEFKALVAKGRAKLTKASA